MNLTRRNILKALGIGAAVSVSGASIAKDPKVTNWDEVQAAGKLMDAQEVPTINAIWNNGSTVWVAPPDYKVGDKIIGTDGIEYEAIGVSTRTTI